MASKPNSAEAPVQNTETPRAERSEIGRESMDVYLERIARQKLGPLSPLNVPHRPGYWLEWVEDTDEKIQERIHYGWKVVEEDNLATEASVQIQRPKSMGKGIRVSKGAERFILMEIPQELKDAIDEQERNRVNRIEGTIHRENKKQLGSEGYGGAYTPTDPVRFVNQADPMSLMQD